MPAYDFIVLGHSHAVAFLDGVTNWRQQIKPSAPASHDSAYGGAFQGWHAGVFPDELLELSMTAPGLSSHSLLARVMSATSAVKSDAEYIVRNGKKILNINPDFLTLLKGLPARVPIVSFLNGNEHAEAMLGNLPPYDFLEPEVPGRNVAPGVAPIDTLFIDDIVKSWLSPLLPSLLAIRRATGSRVIHVLPPPPREDPHAAQYLEALHALVRKHGFAPDALRLKWYRRYCRMVTAALAPMECEVLAPPCQTLTEAGLLKSSLAEGLTHGNAAYGTHLAHALEEKIGRGT